MPRSECLQPRTPGTAALPRRAAAAALALKNPAIFKKITCVFTFRGKSCFSHRKVTV